MVARLVRDQEAVGSNPATPTIRSFVRQRFHRHTRDYFFALKKQKSQEYLLYEYLVDKKMMFSRVF